MENFYALVTGNTLDSHEDIIRHVNNSGLTKVKTPQESDVIIAFCPIASRVGTDIEDALTKIPEGIQITQSKINIPDHDCGLYNSHHKVTKGMLKKRQFQILAYSVYKVDVNPLLISSICIGLWTHSKDMFLPM